MRNREGKMTTYTTDELINKVNLWFEEMPVCELEDRAVREQVVARLRAADELYAAVITADKTVALVAAEAYRKAKGE
jgi:hypothetical protein